MTLQRPITLPRFAQKGRCTDRMDLATGARFRVSGLLKIQSRPGAFVCGEVLTGTVKSGMEIAWPVHGDAITVPLLVRAVEFIDYALGVSEIALAIRFEEDEAKYEQLLRDCLEVGMEVAIHPAAQTADASARRE